MFDKPKSSSNIIFKSTITKAKQIQLQILYYGFCKEAKVKKMSFRLKIPKLFIVCKIY